jgi:molybdenum cofactor cytidylyltransferase
MKFGLTPIEEAEGAVLAHGVRIDGSQFKKGDTLTRERRLALAAAGVTKVVAARLEPGDVGENEAAVKLAKRLAGAKLRCSAPFTGRVNLFAEAAGLAIIAAEAIDRVNAIDEAVTVATLPPYRAVADGDMVATVKIIPFATTARTLDAALAALGPAGAIAVQPFRSMRIGVVSTMLPGLKASVVANTLRALEARLAPTGARIAAQEIVPHEVGPLAKALCRLIDNSDALVAFGASAITDRRDVIPAAIEAIGGRIERFGMPVDPGNLLLLAERGGIPIIGAPGCARSPKENGFDWVLQRMLAGTPIRDADIRAMGVGGLLMEIGLRPQPRASLE